MGIDFGDLFGQVKDSVSSAVEDLKKTGLPALEASLEKMGSDALSKMSDNTQKTVDQNVKEILSRPSDPNGIGAYLSKTLASPITQQYGGLIVGGVAVIAVFALMIFSRRA